MARYHVNNKGEVSQCKAMVSCPFGDLDKDHYSDKSSAREAFEAKMVNSFSKGFHKPISTGFYGDYFSLNASNYISDYDYDEYTCYGCFGCENPDSYEPCRGSEYVNLRLVSIDEKELLSVAKKYMGWDYSSDYQKVPKHIQEDFEKFVEKDLKKFLSPSDWSIHGEPDYYGETVVINPPSGLKDLCREWYYNQPGASDRDSVLPYLRGKGFDTVGKDPLTAMKDHLAEENQGMRLPEVESAENISKSTIFFSRIKMNEKHYEKVDAREPSPVRDSGSGQKIIGVLLKTGEKEYKLLDGYHRLKHMKEKEQRRNGNFMVLS